MSRNPYEPSPGTLQGAPAVPVLSTDRVRRIATLQKLLILAIVFQLASRYVPVVGWLLYLANLLFQAVIVYRLATAIEIERQGFTLGGRSLWWVVGSLVPVLSLVVLVVLNQRATRFLQRAGIPVGLLGAKLPAA